jgi:hypothetical protein
MRWEGEAYCEPEIDANCETKGGIDELGALPDEAAMDGHVGGHFADRRVLGVDNDSVPISICILRAICGLTP